MVNLLVQRFGLLLIEELYIVNLEQEGQLTPMLEQSFKALAPERWYSLFGARRVLTLCKMIQVTAPPVPNRLCIDRGVVVEWFGEMSRRR